MEISKAQIARLVLGYLKSEGCKKAFNEFLIKSHYLKSHAVFVKNGKYFATRVGGLTLEDILADYSDVSLIIEGRLEQTDYYDKGHRMKLSDQLMYILNHNSRSSSPALAKDLNATLSESLPGNSSKISHSPNVKLDNATGFQSSSNVTTITQLKEGKKTMMADLDKQMKTIEEKREQDPVFDQILEEIIGHKDETSTEGHISSNFSEKSRSSTDAEVSKTTKSNNKKTDDSHAGTKNSDVIVMEPYVNNSITTTCQPPQNQYILTNTPGGLLMLPSVMAPSNYILVNSGQTAPPAPLTSNVLTETDIMKMPTVILEDGPSTRPSLFTVAQPQLSTAMTQSQIIITTQPHMTVAAQTSKTTTSSSNFPNAILQQDNSSQSHSVRRVKTIAPKTDRITIATSDGDYFKVFDKEQHIQSSPREVEAETSNRSPKHHPSLKGGLLKVTSRNKTPPSQKEPPGESGSSIVDSAPKKELRKSAKNLFKNNKIKKEAWDADLRDLLISTSQPEKADSSLDTSDEKIESSDDRLDQTNDKLDVTCDDEELKKEALMIEAAFKTPVKSQVEPKEEEAMKKEEKKEATKSPQEIVEVQHLKDEVIETVETELYLRNCNGPPRFKKKCNQTNMVTETLEVEIVEEHSPTAEASNANTKAKGNTMLETPVKWELPKTPGKMEMTPLTRVLEEQLKGMDLLSLSTPKLAITPGFAITPHAELNTPDFHSNRPTDYSTSSSYYQPSDTEQNRSLEMVMEEYRKEDRKKAEMKKAEEQAKKDKETSKVPAVSDMKRMFNENVIGKKNLSMMKQENPPCLDDSSNSSNSSSSSTSKSSTDTESDSDFDYSKSKKTITSPKKLYSFRKRKSPVPQTPNESEVKKIVPSPKTTKKTVSVQEELKEKRNRTIKAIKKGSPPVPKNNPPRQKDGKFTRYKAKNVALLKSGAPPERRKSVKPENRPAPPKDKKEQKETFAKTDTEPKTIENDAGNKVKCEETKEKDQRSRRCPQKKSESKSQNKPASKDDKTGPKTDIEDGNKNDEAVEIVAFEADTVENTVIETKRGNEDESRVSGLGTGDDDLMNFAVLGNMMDEQKESSQRVRDKRKISTEDDNLPPEKKCKTENEKNQALLKRINVDLFLNKLHGKAKPS